MEFRIMESIYYGPDGKNMNRYYFIQMRKKLFGLFPYWKTLKHEVCDLDCYYVITQFNTQEDAERMINEVLMGGGKVDGWIERVVKHIVH